MNKYDLLYEYLSKRKRQVVTLTFSEIESIIGAELPMSAYKYPQWWSNSRTKAHPYCQAWLEAGFKTVDVKNNIAKQIVTFE